MIMKPRYVINSICCMTKYFKDMNVENRESFVECMLAKLGQFLILLKRKARVTSKRLKDFFKICSFLFMHSVSSIEDVIAEENAALELQQSQLKERKKAAAPDTRAIDWVTLRKACLLTFERLLAAC